MVNGLIEEPLKPTIIFPYAARDWVWQYVFPIGNLSQDPHTKDNEKPVTRRHHLQDQSVQDAMRQTVVDAAITKPTTPHTLRHYPEFRTMPSRL